MGSSFILIKEDVILSKAARVIPCIKKKATTGTLSSSTDKPA